MGDDSSDINLRATASGGARVNQAGRDLVIQIGQGGGPAIREVLTADAVEVCPYPGLSAFTQDEARFYRGRGRAVADLVARLDERWADPAPICVVAPSGAGKSSLLRAGLLPAIESGRLAAPGARTSPRLIFTPTAEPLAAFAEALSGACGPAVADVLADLAADDPVAALRDRIGAGTRLIVVVDQFEEVFSLCPDEEQRQRFIDLLMDVAAARPGLASLVLGLRADFYSAAAAHPRLRAALQTDQLLLGPMTAGELREAITVPATLAGLSLEDGLVEVLLRDLGASGRQSSEVYEVGRLPLLAYALQASWRVRSGHVLTVAGYETTGGIRRAITTTAERTFHGLDGEQRAAARTMFLQLVTVTAGAYDTRRRAGPAALVGGSADPGAVAAAANAFTRARLLTLTEDAVEISHEALLSEWPRLRDWIDDDRAGLVVRQRLESAAEEWAAAEDRSLLYLGSRLTAARESAPDETSLTERGRRFLDASSREQRRGQRRRRALIAGLAALALVACGSAVVALQQRATAVRQTRRALSENHALEVGSLLTAANAARSGNPSLAARLDLAAYRMQPDGAARTQLLGDAAAPLARSVGDDVEGTDDLVTDASGRTVVTASRPSGQSGVIELRLWGWTAQGTLRRTGTARVHVTGYGTRVMFAGTGETLLVSTGTGAIRLWDVGDPARPAETGTVPVPGGKTWTMAISPHGTDLAICAGRTVTLWNVARPAAPVRTASATTAKTAACEAVSPAGLVALTEERVPELWSPKAGGLGRLYADGSRAENNAVFGLDGQTLSWTDSDTLITWNLRTLTKIRVGQPAVLRQSGATRLTAAGNEGMLVATTGSVLTLWNISNIAALTPISTVSVTSRDITGIAPGPGGSLLVEDGGGQIRQWSMPPTAIVGSSTSIAGISFGGRSDRYVVAYSRYLVTLSNSTPVKVLSTTDVDNGVMGARLDPTGDLVAVGDDSPSVCVFDPLTTGEVSDDQCVEDDSGDWEWLLVGIGAVGAHGTRLVAGTLLGLCVIELQPKPDLSKVDIASCPIEKNATVDAIDLNTGGDTLAVLTADTVDLWDIGAASPVLTATMPIGHNGGEATMALGDDGHLVAVSTAQGDVQLWRADGRRAVRVSTVGGDGTGVATLAFDRASRTLAVATRSGALNLWDVTDVAHPAGLGTLVRLQATHMTSIAFSPDGSTMITGESGGLIRVWPLSTASIISRICGTTTGALTAAQWQSYLPDIPYADPCGKN